MREGKKRKGQNKIPKKIRLIISICFFIFFSGLGLSYGDDWTLLPWGLNLEELNQAVKEKFNNGQIKEDKDRSEIEFQYAPVKSLKIRRGKIVALLSSWVPATPGHLYGYNFEGKIFGRVILFKDHPEFFPETVIRNLKKQYPEGKIVRNISMPQGIPFFEHKSDQLYIFSTERGVFYYEPSVLEKVMRVELGNFSLEEKKYEKGLKDETGYK
jgi:hypothetical protein